MAYISGTLRIYNNGGTTSLYYNSGDTSMQQWVVTETGAYYKDNEYYKYTYEGTKKFIGLATTANATTPTYAIGDTFTCEQSTDVILYIVETEKKTNEEIFKEKMDALAISIVNKSGGKGKKSLDELKEIVDDVLIPSTEGTPIPIGKKVKEIYFNTINTTEQTDAYLSQLTYIQTQFLPDPLYPIYAYTEDGTTGCFIIAQKKSDDNYIITVIEDVINQSFIDIYDSREPLNNSFITYYDDYTNGFDYYMNGFFLNNKESLSEWNGLPIGTENEKLKYVLSTTPFVTESNLAIEEFDGTVEVVETTITFTINGIEYQADNGMTWEQWCGTEYNTYDFHISGSSIMTTKSGIAPDYIQYNGIDVLPSDEIIDGEYTLRREDVGGW